MECDYMAELATVDRIMRERDHIDDLLYLIDNGQYDRLREVLQRDRDSLEESLKSK